MKKTNITLCTLGLLFILSGCVSTSVTKLDPNANYPKVDQDNVSVYMTPKDIPCDFKKVAMINTKAGYGWKTEKSIKAARKKAGEMGANGLVIDKIKDPGTGDKVANFFLGTGANKKGTYVAIRTFDRGCSDNSDGNK